MSAIPPSGREPIVGVGSRGPSAARSGNGPRDVATVLAVRVGVVALGVAVQSALARTLLPADRGAYALVSAVAIFLCLASSASVHSGAQYEILKGRVSASQGVSSSLAVAMAGSLLASALAAPLILGGAWAGPGRQTLLLALAIMPACAFAATANALLPTFWRFGSAGSVEMLMNATQVAGTLALVGWLGLGLDGAVLAFVGCNVAGGAFALGVLRRRCSVGLVAPEPGAVRALVRYGGRIHAANLIDFSEQRIGLLLLALLASREEVGLLAAANVLAVGVYALPSAFSWALLPRLTGVPESRPALAAFSMRVVAWSAVLGLIVLALLREPFVRVVLGAEFMPVAGLVPALAPGLAAGAMSQVAIAYIKARGRAELPSYAAVVQMALTVGLVLALYPRMGLAGAAWGTSAALVARCVLLTAFFCRLSGESWTAPWRLRRADFAVMGRAMGAMQPSRSARRRP